MLAVTHLLESLGLAGPQQYHGDGQAARLATWQSTGIVGLRSTNLKALPDSVLELGTAARTLDATGNKLGELPEALSKLVSLQRLILAENNLQQLPRSIGALVALKVLVLDANRLAVLPEEVGQLARLERLSVARNSLLALPHSLGRLKKLVHLDVHANQLKGLPPTIGDCVALEELHATGNGLVTLPDSLCRLKRLKTLSLDANRLSVLPPQLLVACISLQTLTLHDNPIDRDSFQEMAGFAAFEGRRRDKVDKQLAGNVLMTSRNLDDGVDAP